MARARDNSSRSYIASFTNGEISPRLYGRVDLQQYGAGLALCENFYPTPHGGVANRPGTRFIAYVKDEAHKPRLVPFRFSQGAGQNYILEFGDLYFRVFMNGGQVVYSSGPNVGDPVEVVTPYATDELDELNWTQSADVMTLVHPSHEPYELTRTDHDAWTLTAVTFGPSLSAPGGSDVTTSKGGAGTGTSWKYQVTWETETGEESLPGPTETQDHAATLTTTNYVGFTISSYPTDVVYADIYKYRGGSFGWIGASADGTFIDDGISPDLSSTPPRARNPFSGSGDYPRAAAYYQQRLALAGSQNSPETLWLSQTGAFKNFTTSEPLRDSDAITATLSGQNVDVIRHLVPHRSLMILCKGGVWTLERGDSGLTPSLEGGIASQLAEGCSLLRPILAGSDVLYVQEGGRIIRAVDFSVERQGLQSEDISLLSEHLLRDYPAVDWTWCANPDRLLWIVREDGVLLSVSYLRAERVFGWARHSTGAEGLFERVASIPESDGDAAYFVVKRWIGGTWRRCIERMAIRRFAIQQDSYFVDCGLTYDAPITITNIEWDATTVTVTAAGHGLVEGDVVDIVGVPDVVGIDERRLVVSAPVTADHFDLSISGEDLDQDDDEPMTEDDVSGQYLGGGSVLKAVSTISGLDHLEGQEVMVLADGSVEGPYTVSSGSVTLLRPASRIQAGLGYDCVLRTLPIASAQSAAVRARTKRVTSLQIHLEASRGVWAGPSLTDLEEYRQRTDELLGNPVLPTTGMIELTVPTTWSRDGQVYLSNNGDPLPLLVLAISPEFESGTL